MSFLEKQFGVFTSSLVIVFSREMDIELEFLNQNVKKKS